MIDVAKLSKEEREFVTGIINRLDGGDVKNVGAELLAEFVSALTPEIFQKGYRLGDVLCQGKGAHAFNEALTWENKSPLHMICVGFALSQEGKKTSTTSLGDHKFLAPLLAMVAMLISGFLHQLVQSRAEWVADFQ
jgi:hypothetical protein